SRRRSSTRSSRRSPASDSGSSDARDAPAGLRGQEGCLRSGLPFAAPLGRLPGHRPVPQRACSRESLAYVGKKRYRARRLMLNLQSSASRTAPGSASASTLHAPAAHKQKQLGEPAGRLSLEGTLATVVLVVDSGMPRNAPASHMHGFLSRDGFSPSELLELGREEVAGYGGQIVDASVVKVQSLAGGFRVALDSRLAVSARRLLVATGLR